MTISAEETATRLLPCPFCGAPSHRVEIPTVGSELGGDPNAGGSYIECTRCAASSAIHFDRKENLESSWNERIDHSAELKELFESAKAIIRDCAAALGNGAFVSPECSDEFHAQVPIEITKCVSALRARIASLESERDQLRKQVEGPFVAGMRKAAEIANDTYETYKSCSDWDYGAQNACVALERAILAAASALEQTEQG